MKKSGATAASAAAARKTSLEAIKAKARKAMRKGFSDAGLEEVVDPFQKVWQLFITEERCVLSFPYSV